MKNFLGINWQVRFNNPTFWVNVGIAIITPILAYFGLTGADMTSWQTLGTTALNAASNPYVCILVIISVWNAVQDPTTKGVTDSARALTYTKPNK